MSKINILLSDSDYSNFETPWFEPVIAETFNIKFVEHGHKHTPNDSIVVVNYLNADRKWCTDLANQGYKIVIDHLWDSNIFEKTQIQSNALVLRNKNWCWYNESLWYTYLGYNTYKPNKDITHSFLMMMNLSKPHRDQIIDKLQPILSKSLYSYVGKGIHINNDTSITDYPASMHWERYFNPAWYDSTAFSVAVETMIDSPTFVSEKIFKPMAYYHPLVVWGSTGTLAYLHEQGFETFNHAIDESYDTIVDPGTRLNEIVSIITELTESFTQKIIPFEDSLSKQKMQHNHNRFFNRDLVIDRVNREIVHDILEYFESSCK